MKKITILAASLFILSAYQATAQMGIGTPNPSNASMLDVLAEDKGVLIPRVALENTTNYTPIIGNEEESLLVYNTHTSSDLEDANAVYPGFYYRQNGAWQRVVNQADLNTAIENLDNEFNTSIEQIHDLINYIAPSNPNNVDENGDPIVVESHSTVVWDEINNSFYVVTYDPVAESYIKNLIDIEALVAGLETNTFIRVQQNADAPNTYHYFSEFAIKTWMADPANAGLDPLTDMPSDDLNVVTIDVVGDVVTNFEYILEQEITYEGDTHTIEQIIQMISSEVEGNVRYFEINPREWVFQYFDGTDYVTINLDQLVNELETNTFIRKVDGVVNADPTLTTPTVYYYFSEEAIKDWVALNPTLDVATDMPVTDPGVIAIEVADDVANNFEYILNQEITYEGEQVTIEEIIQLISSEVEGNVIYTEVDGEMVFQYYDTITEQYITINLDQLVNELETNTFIRKVDAVVETDGTVTSPTVYYYFSEEAIKDWVALNPTLDVATDMPETALGVIAIEVADDVANNFEYILNQEITYEGEQVTIEEIIQLISSQVNGNVIYTEINPGEWVFQYFDGTDYVTINLGDLVANLETKTTITRAAIDADGETPTYAITVETDPTFAGQILYKYDSEDGTDYLNITEDLLFSLTNNEEVKNQITNILGDGGGVFFGDVTIEGDDYTDVLYYYDDNGDAQLIDVAKTLIQNLIDNSTQVQELKNILGDKYEDNTIIYTGDTINGNPVAAFTTTTTIGVHTAVTGGVTLPETPNGVVAISLYKNGVLVTNSTTDHVIAGNDVNFNIGIGNHYQVLPENTYEVIIEFTVAP